jgi:nucleoside-diphosphate-sugar epimerase
MPKTQAEEDAIVRLAVEGTINVLKAAQKYKVARVVVTSSTAAIIDRTKSFKGKVMSEKDWALAENATSAY